MRSKTIKEGLERLPHRALLYATGIPRSEMGKPFIGVVTSFTDLIPGHTGMRDLERFIEKGVHTGGGYPFFFGVPGICDGIAMGHGGMHYSLASRELTADMIPAPADDLTAKLQQLAQLHASGVLNDEEFAAAKQKLLAG